jgi:hypothetical protein
MIHEVYISTSFSDLGSNNILVHGYVIMSSSSVIALKVYVCREGDPM